MPSPFFYDEVDANYDRRSSRSIKWTADGAVRVAASIADMDLAVAPPILAAIRSRLAHPFLGYDFPERASSSALIEWYSSIHQTVLDQNNIIEFPFGPRSALQFIERSLLRKDDVLLILTPTYPGLRRLGNQTGCLTLEWEMSRCEGRYGLNYQHLDRILASTRPTVFAICNPNNPTGQILPSGEISDICEYLRKRGALRLLISDEVHGDLVYPCNSATSVLSIPAIADYSLVLSGVGKTFNLSGLSTSYAISKNDDIISDLKRCLNREGFYEGSLLGGIAQMAALTQGRTWRDNVVTHLQSLAEYAVAAFSANGSKLTAYMPEASFLMAIDYSDMEVDEAFLRSEFLRAGISVQYSERFSANRRNNFFRFNFGAPRRVVEDWISIILDSVAGSH